jgi:hypothetical protein
MPLYALHGCARAGSRRCDAAGRPDAHAADLEAQERYGVRYLRYWFDATGGKIFCLVEAPNAEVASAVHREAHGLVAERVHEVVEGS